MAVKGINISLVQGVRAAWLELPPLVPGAAAMLEVKLLKILGVIPQKHFLELLGVVWRKLGGLEQRISGLEALEESTGGSKMKFYG